MDSYADRPCVVQISELVLNEATYIMHRFVLQMSSSRVIITMYVVDKKEKNNGRMHKNQNKRLP